MSDCTTKACHRTLRKRRIRFGSTEPEDLCERPSAKRHQSESTETRRRLACPFYKHNPNVISKSCNPPGWHLLHHVKEHIKRVHIKTPHCGRCRTKFGSAADVTKHLQAHEPCERRDPSAEPEGTLIEKDTYHELCRRGRGKSDVERWKEIYKTLFPGALIVPSPFVDGLEHMNHLREEAVRDFLKFLLTRLPNTYKTVISEDIEDTINEYMKNTGAEDPTQQASSTLTDGLVPVRHSLEVPKSLDTVLSPVPVHSFPSSVSSDAYGMADLFCPNHHAEPSPGPLQEIFVEYDQEPIHVDSFANWTDLSGFGTTLPQVDRTTGYLTGYLSYLPPNC